MVVDAYEYTPYGQPLDATSAIGNEIFFGGQRYDRESGYYYMGHRYYDPVDGRFITPDPLGAWADPMNAGNAYAYAGNSPWNYDDPTGLFTRFSAGGDGLFGILDPNAEIPTRYGGSLAIAASTSELAAELGNIAMLAYCVATDPSLDNIQLALDVLGTIEPFGAIADGLNATIYLARGQWGNAAISVASIFAFDAIVKPLRFADELVGAFRGADGALTAGAHGADNMLGAGARGGENALGGAAARDINPSGGTQNCAHCAITMDHRLGGGGPASAVNRGPESVSYVANAAGGGRFSNAGQGPSAQDTIVQYMNSLGPGSRGIVYANFGPGTMGHFYNVVNQLSGVNFLDAQSGTGGARHFQVFTHFWVLITNKGRAN